MKDVKNTTELIDLINSENYYYNGNDYENYNDLEEAANNFFNEITEDSDDKEKYYSDFGLKVGECFVREVKSETYYNEESNCTNTVKYYEAYIDSGVDAESYFYGYTIDEN